MHKVLYPGSFDPVTAGHMDIIRRAASQFEQVVVGVLHNPLKPSGAFTPDERVELLQTAVAELSNVTVDKFSGLLVDAVAACGADAVVRGLRTMGDAELELQMARLNRQIGGAETLFLAATPEVMHISAEMVRQVGRYGGNLHGLVPETVFARIEDTLKRRG